MTDIFISARRGGGAPAEMLYGTVTFKPTLAHSRSTSIVLPAPTTFDLVDGEVVAHNIQPTPEPVDGQIEWAYEVTFKDRYDNIYSFIVGVPDSTTQVNFTNLPRYFETKPPLFGQGPQGEPGEAATIAIGNVTSGTTPSVSNSGTNTDAVLDFVLPKGDKGDKGDNSTYLPLNSKVFADAPSTYPNGMSVVRSSTSTAGWPYTVSSITTSYAGYAGSAWQIIKDNQTNNNSVTYIRFANVGTADTWGALQPLVNGLATGSTNGLMSSADKTKLDNMTTLGYGSKLPTDAPSTYPAGVSTGLFKSSDGWPNINGRAFANVTTFIPRSYNTALQIASGYYNTEASLTSYSDLLFRNGSTTGGWTDWQRVITDKNQPYVTPEQFGAKADGTTDDTTAIQQALDSAVQSGKGLVFDGTKTYRVTAGIASPPISKPTTLNISSIGGIATLVSSDQTTRNVLEIGGSPNGAERTVTQNVDTQSNYFVISGNASDLYDGTLYYMISSQPWYFDPRTESTDCRRSELHVQASRNVNGITLKGSFAESYSATTETLTVQPYHPMTVKIDGLRIVRDLPPVAQESARHGLLRVSYTTNSVLKDIYLDGGTEYGLSLRNNYGMYVAGGAATNCNNYWTGYGISVAGSHHVDISGYTITNSRRGVDVTQGGKCVSRYVKIHDMQIIGGGKNSRGENYGWNLNGSTAAQQSGMGSHGGADRCEYYDNTLVRLHDPITMRGGNETARNNVIYGKTVNGAFGLSFGGGTVTIKGNKVIVGTETGPFSQTAYNNPTSKLGECFLKIYNSINPNMHLIVKDNECEVQKDFIVIQDAQVAIPLRMDVQNNSVLYRTSESEVRLISNESAQGLYTYPASAYRNTFAFNRQSVLAGSPTVKVTSNINIANARVAEYSVSPATS